MNPKLTRRDLFFGCLAVAGLASLIAFEWLPGLVIFAVGGVYLVANGASVNPS